MKTSLTVATLALLGALGAASGCADNRASIQVQYVCEPTATCTFANGCDTQYSGYAVYDPATSTVGGIVVFLNVKNQLSSNESAAAGRLNTNDAHVDETFVELEGLVTGQQTLAANAYVPAGGKGVVGVVIALPVPADPTSGAHAAGEVLARTRLRGYYDDGTRFETGEFPIAILVSDDSAPAKCGTAPTCPATGEGQRPLTCGSATP